MGLWVTSSMSSSLPAQVRDNLADTYISIPLGIIIGLLASFVQSLGLTIQRKSHVLNQLLPEHQQRVEHRRPLWLLGFAIFISSNILGSLVQIASLPVVILAPLGAVSLLWNAFFARVLLGDVFSPWMVLGTLLIAGGAVLIAVFGIVPEPTHSVEDLLALFRRPAFVAYFSSLGTVVFVALLITHAVEFSLSRRTASSYDTPLVITSPSAPPVSLPENPSTLTTGVTNTISEAITTERTSLLSRDRRDRKASSSSSPPPSSLSKQALTDPSIQRTRLLLAISYASFSGIISGMCLIFAKSGVELLVLTIRGHNQFWRWESWVLVLGLIVFALLQLWYLHKALILANPTLVCPSAFCFYNLSSIVNGLVYFDQFSLIRPLHLGLVAIGIVVLLGGVWVVSIQSGDDSAEDSDWSDEDSSDGEIAIRQQPEETSGVNEYHYESDEEGGMDTAAVERMFKSESNIHDTVPSLGNIAAVQGLGLGRPPPRPSSGTSFHREPELVPSLDTSVSASHVRQSSDIPLSMTSSTRTTHNPRRHPRRPTVDTYVGPFSNYGSQNNTKRHHHTPHHANTLSHLSQPPLNAVSTLGTGFQIGLSPVSPGFSIVPRGGGRRASGMGFNGASREGSEMGTERRRRTVSEGDFRQRAPLLDVEEQHGARLDTEVGGIAAGQDGNSSTGLRQDSLGKGKGKVSGSDRPAKGRWKWLKNVFVWRGQ